MIHFLALILIFVLCIIFFVLAFIFGLWRMIFGRGKKIEREAARRSAQYEREAEKPKVFSDDEGEYVDFEEVDAQEKRGKEGYE